MVVAEMAELKTRRKRPLRPGPGLSASAPPEPARPGTLRRETPGSSLGARRNDIHRPPKRKKTCDAARPSRPARGREAARLRRARPSGSVTAQETGLSRREARGGAAGLPRSAAPVPPAGRPDRRGKAGIPFSVPDLMVVHAGLRQTATLRHVAVDPTLRPLVPGNVERREAGKEVEFGIGQMVVNPPCQRPPVRPSCETIREPRNHDAGGRARMAVGVAPVPDMARVTGLVRRAGIARLPGALLIVAEGVHGAGPVGGTHDDLAEAFPERLEKLPAQVPPDLDRKVGVVRNVRDAVKIRHVAVEKFPQEERGRKAHTSQLVQRRNGPRLSHGDGSSQSSGTAGPVTLPAAGGDHSPPPSVLATGCRRDAHSSSRPDPMPRAVPSPRRKSRNSPSPAARRRRPRAPR